MRGVRVALLSQLGLAWPTDVQPGCPIESAGIINDGMPTAALMSALSCTNQHVPPSTLPRSATPSQAPSALRAPLVGFPPRRYVPSVAEHERLLSWTASS